MNSNSKPPKKHTYLLIASLTAVTIIAAFAVGFLIGSHYSSSSKHVIGYSILATEGVEAYWDISLENKVGEIDWGTIRLGSSKNVMFYVRRMIDIETPLYLETRNWEPANISNHVDLTWNYNASKHQTNETTQVTLTMSAPRSDSFVDYLAKNNVKNFSSNVNIGIFTRTAGPIEVASGWENATNVFPLIPNYDLKFLYRDTTYERITGQDASLLYAYSPNNLTDPTIYVDVNIATTISNLHDWEEVLANLTSNGAVLLESRDIQLLINVPIIGHYLVFESPQNYTQITLYWYEKATFSTGIAVEQKYASISLTILTSDSANYQQFESQLVTLGQLIVYYWTS